MDADTVIPILLILAVPGVAIVVLMARDQYKAWRTRKSPEELESERQEFIRRLHHPEWPAIERALGRGVPRVLRDLYNDSEWLTGNEFRVISPFEDRETVEDHPRARLSPATPESLARLESISVDVFQFATDEFGNPYGVQLFEEPDRDGAVFLHMLDGDTVFRIADSLADLLSWPKRRIAL